MSSTKILSQLLKNIQILYVEDELETRDIIVEVLSAFTNNIKVAKNGKEALEIYSQGGIQLIITDIEMPVMDGIEFIEKVREDDILIPVIMLTAYTSTEYLLKTVNLNIQSYIVKPINYTKLKSTLYSVVEYLNQTSNIYVHINNELSYDKSKGILIENKTKEITLNKKEKTLMDLLVDSKNSLVTYSQIEHSVWFDYDEVMTDTALRTVIKNLRKKSSIKFIENVSGLGYKLSK